MSIRKILHLDDDADDCSIFQEIVQKINSAVNYECLHVATELIPKALSEMPDLIFLDIDMPKINGFECLSQLKKHFDLREIPVVLYSSAFRPVDIEKAYFLGAHLYITKPNSLKEIEATLRAVFDLNWEEPDLIPAHQYVNGKYTSFECKDSSSAVAG